MDSRSAPNDQDILLADIERFMTRWRFAVSVAGYLLIQPTGPRLSRDEMNDMFERLRPVYPDGQFETVAFDFCDVSFADSEWMQMKALLAAFAGSIDADLRAVSAPNRYAAIVVISRPHRPGPARG